MPEYNVHALNISVFNAPSPAGYVATDFEGAIATALRSGDALNAIIDGNAYPIVIPEDVSGPAVTYQIKEKPRDWMLDGPAGIAAGHVTFTARSVSYQESRAIQLIIRRMFTPTLAVVPLDLFGITVLVCVLVNESHEYAMPPENADMDIGAYLASVDFLFRYRES